MALSDNIVAYYKLDETSGTTATDSIGSYNGTNNGATVNQAGKIGKAYDFTYADEDYVTLGINLASYSAFSFSCWFYRDAGTYELDRTTILGGGSGNNGATIQLYSSNEVGGVEKLNANVWNYGNLVADTAFNNGGWNHVVWTYDKSTKEGKLYMNGESVGTITYTGIISASSTFLGVSTYSGIANRNYAWDGKIDEVGVWNKVLTSTEVEELYNLGDGLSYPFATSVTIYPAVLSISTAEETINARVNLTGEALQSTISLKTATISAVNPTYTRGQKEIKTSWDELTALDPTKAVGHIQNLIPLVSLVPSIYNVGI